MKSTNEIDEKKKEINKLLIRAANAFNRKKNIKRKQRKQERQNKKRGRNETKIH